MIYLFFACVEEQSEVPWKLCCDYHKHEAGMTFDIDFRRTVLHHMLHI